MPRCCVAACLAFGPGAAGAADPAGAALWLAVRTARSASAPHAAACWRAPNGKVLLPVAGVIRRTLATPAAISALVEPASLGPLQSLQARLVAQFQPKQQPHSHSGNLRSSSGFTSPPLGRPAPRRVRPALPPPLTSHPASFCRNWCSWRCRSATFWPRAAPPLSARPPPRPTLRRRLALRSRGLPLRPRRRRRGVGLRRLDIACGRACARPLGPGLPANRQAPAEPEAQDTQQA